MTISSLPTEIRKLPIAERLLLAEEIWNSVVEDEQDFEMHAQQKHALLHRIALNRENPNSGKPWETLKSELLGD